MVYGSHSVTCHPVAVTFMPLAQPSWYEHVCLSMCLSVCVSVRERTPGIARPISPLLVHVSYGRDSVCSIGGVAIRYVIPVLWMMSRYSSYILKVLWDRQYPN